MLSFLAQTYLSSPVPPATLNPPAADRVSVQPGSGSFIAEFMIEGLNNTQGKDYGFLFFNVLSAIDLVYEYVFGHGPKISLS
jgi:hypothetical protein